MAKSYEVLREKLTPEQRARSDAKLKALTAHVRLQELRKARAQTQETIAELMGVPQSAISKIEKRTDAYVSTIRRYLEAMGGHLHITAEFPDGASYEIEQFAEIGEPETELVTP
jgi:transcriptional regulator with XRE-family HTH domain